MELKDKNNVILRNLILCMLIILSMVVCVGCTKPKDNLYTAVWWWDSELCDEYFDFAVQNKVTHIYYCDSDFGEDTTKFIKKCRENDIDVYYLDGRYQWLTDVPKRAQLYARLDSLLSFNAGEYKFAGVHLDIEPHQAPNFDEDREDLIVELISLANELRSLYPTIDFEYDIPFWFDDEVVYNGVSKPAYAHMIDVADRVTVMSYRDTATEIYKVAEDEIKYAQSTNKPLNLSVETGEEDIDKVTFYEEGNDYMINELNILREMIPENFGIVVHHIKTWKELI
ncbi:MAG: hypothetical protein IKB42_00585 [Clostridia bacterium]|nr:hypothetical protein [Clostridia bacterium]